MEIQPHSNSQWFFDNFEQVAKLEGISLTIASFNKYFKEVGTIFISCSVFLFAFSTMLSGSYYGETALMYIFAKAHLDKNSITPLSHHAATAFKLVFVIFIYPGAEKVVNFTDLTVGLMVIPNSIAILALSGKIKRLGDDYFTKPKAGKFPRYT